MFYCIFVQLVVSFFKTERSINMKVLKIFLVFLLVMVLMGACTFWLRAKWDREYEQTELGKRTKEIYENHKRI